MSSSAAEKLVKELARKPSNTVCANCGTRKKFGFSTVCIKFHTFVCNNCKSSHQAISHRCKSLTMSSWTDAEVAELKRKGNDYARRTWLKNAPPVGQGGRPKEGDSVDVFKRFVVQAYEHKKYYGEDDGTGEAAPAQPAPAAAAARVSARATRAPVRKAVPPPAPAPAPVADLLDFTAMSSPTPQAAAANNGSSSNAFEANFDAFAPTTPSVSSGPSTAPAVQNDPFAAQPTPTSNASSFAFMNRGSTTTPANTPAIPAIKKPVMKSQSTTPATVSNTSSGSFQANFDAFAPSATASTSTKPTATAVQNDPFQPATTQATQPSNGSSFSFMNNSSTTPSVVPAIKKPVMNNSSMSQKSSLISSMNMPSPQQGNQNNMGMGMGMGMGWNNNCTGTNNNSLGGMGNMNSMQSQMMMQQQQMNMMNGMMNGMNLNNNGMSNGMSNGMGMGMMGNSNPMMMMGNNNNMMMMGNNNPMMMNQQRNTMNGNNNFGGNSKRNSNGPMQSLQMNMSSMNAWSSGAK